MKIEVFNAILGLLNKLDQVSDATAGIFLLAKIHGAEYSGPTYEAERDVLRDLIGTVTPPNQSAIDWDKWERDGCVGCEYDVGDVRIIWFDKTCPIHGHGFRELAEIDFARARFDSLRETIKELAELEKEHQTNFRPSREWFARMVKIEDECGGHISVGGLAADLGILPEDPEKHSTFLMMGSDGEPMGTMSNPSLDDLVYYMRSDASSVRLLSKREAELADRCNTYDECPAEDPDIVECPMHPELGG